MGRKTRRRARKKDGDGEEGKDEGRGWGGGRRARMSAAKDPLKSILEQSRVGPAPNTILSMYLVRHNSPKDGDLNYIHIFLNKKPHLRVIHPHPTWGNG